jgi:hypothetical protein
VTGVASTVDKALAADVPVSVGSSLSAFSQNKQSEPAVAVDDQHPS